MSKIQFNRGNGNKQISSDNKTVQIQIGPEMLWFVLGVIGVLVCIWLIS